MKLFPDEFMIKFRTALYAAIKAESDYSSASSQPFDNYAGWSCGQIEEMRQKTANLHRMVAHFHQHGRGAQMIREDRKNLVIFQLSQRRKQTGAE